MIKQEFETAKNMVEEVLNEDMKARQNDLWLMLMVWQKKQHIKVFVPYDKLFEMIQPETITRVRRKIQNDEGRLLPESPYVLFKRRVRSELIRAYFSGNEKLIKQWEEIAFNIK